MGVQINTRSYFFILFNGSELQIIHLGLPWPQKPAKKEEGGLI